MILFFDGIGILLPDYLRGKPESASFRCVFARLDADHGKSGLTTFTTSFS
jgi:hypothetical protein